MSRRNAYITKDRKKEGNRPKMVMMFGNFAGNILCNGASELRWGPILPTIHAWR